MMTDLAITRVPWDENEVLSHNSLARSFKKRGGCLVAGKKS